MPDFVAGDFRIIFNTTGSRGRPGIRAGPMASAAARPRVGFSNGSGQPGTFFELLGSGQGPVALLATKSHPPIPPYPRDATSSVQNGAVAQADLAIAAEIFEDEDDTGFRPRGPATSARLKPLRSKSVSTWWAA
jgi:hypothetical protein